MKALTCLVALCGVTLLAWGAYAYRQESRPVLPVTVDSPERDLGEVPVGTTRVVFRVTNPSDDAAEVISAPDACSRGCCLKPVTTAA